MAPPHNMKPSHFLLFPASRFSFVLRNPFLETPQNASKGTGIVCAPLFLLAKAAHSLLVPGVQPPQLRSIQRLQLHVQALVCPVDTVCPWVSRSLHVPEPPSGRQTLCPYAGSVRNAYPTICHRRGHPAAVGPVPGASWPCAFQADMPTQHEFSSLLGSQGAVGRASPCSGLWGQYLVPGSSRGWAYVGATGSLSSTRAYARMSLAIPAAAWRCLGVQMSQGYIW